MNDITPGLRPLRNVSKQPAKVSLTIPPGDELEVSAEVADQLTSASPAIRPADWERTSADPTAFEVVETVDEPDVPVKAPAKKRAPRKRT